MNSEKRLIFKMTDGGIAYVTPVEPVIGTYRFKDGSSLHVKNISESLVRKLDQKIADNDPLAAEFVPEETEDEYLDRIEANLREKHLFDDGVMRPKIPDDWVRVDVVHHSALPADRTFRNAWTHDGKKISHDLDKCKQIHLARLREKRNGALDDLDKETMKNISDPAKLKKIESQKQALRDLPQTIKSQLDAAKSVDAIKAIDPFSVKQ